MRTNVFLISILVFPIFIGFTNFTQAGEIYLPMESPKYEYKGPKYDWKNPKDSFRNNERYTDEDLYLLERDYQYIRERAANARTSYDRQAVMDALIKLETASRDISMYFEDAFNDNMNALDRLDEAFLEVYNDPQELLTNEIYSSYWNDVRTQEDRINKAKLGWQRSYTVNERIQSLKQYMLDPNNRSDDLLLGESFDALIEPGIYSPRKSHPMWDSLENYYRYNPGEPYPETQYYWDPYAAPPAYEEPVDMDFLHGLDW